MNSMKTIEEIGRESWEKRVWDREAAGQEMEPLWLAGSAACRKAADAAACRDMGGKKVHIAGLGDVGRNVALGLVMDGGGIVGKIGLYDPNEKQCRRMEIELSQIAPPPGGKKLPEVRRINWEEVFGCDVFLFCATKSVPAVGSGVADVRMAQYEANRKIVALYAREAAKRRYKGLFGVVSDPVDLLAMEALRSSWEVEGPYPSGETEGSRPSLETDQVRPLHPCQIRGFGLGVMNARAMYYAKRNPEFGLYEKEGRAFGPHGQGLVIANSVNVFRYNDAVSEKLTDLTVHANTEVRELGFKPYIAPAISSAVFTVLALMRGEWQYSAAYLNGLYFGALNRQTDTGMEWEKEPLPDKLVCRLEASRRGLEEMIWGLR